MKVVEMQQTRHGRHWRGGYASNEGKSQFSQQSFKQPCKHYTQGTVGSRGDIQTGKASAEKTAQLNSEFFRTKAFLYSSEAIEKMSVSGISSSMLTEPSNSTLSAMRSSGVVMSPLTLLPLQSSTLFEASIFPFTRPDTIIAPAVILSTLQTAVFSISRLPVAFIFPLNFR